ncbi:hypothetical protein [Paracoccus acridae]|uniref:hypothetical protein n=1 Tax=Paracoccus acridae TaxID=1795310 RepID=UPI001663BF36|nr:hypothetical protein [Paracoccus acridae]
MNSDDHHASAGQNQSTLGNLKEQAGEKVSQAADTLKDEVARREKGLRSGLSRQADQLASALRSARSEVDPDSSIGRMFDYAADSVGSLAQSMNSTDTSDIVHGVRDFARERPGAFLGICALGGFAAARFLLASAPDGHRTGSGGHSGSGYPGGSSGSSYPGSSSRSHGTMGESGSQARSMTGSMSGAGQTRTGAGQAGMSDSGTGRSGTGTGYGTSGTAAGGGTSGFGTTSAGTGGAGSGTMPPSSSTGSMSPAMGTSGATIGGSGAGSEVGGDLSSQSAGTGGTSGTQGQPSRDASATDRNGGRDV